MSLPHGAMAWTALCDCGISWSYLLFHMIFFSSFFFKSTQRVPPAGLCCKLARLIYHGHHATLIETQSSTYAMWLLMIIKLLVCSYCPYNFINAEDRSWMNIFFYDLIFISHKNGKLYKLLFFCLKMVNLWLSFFEVFISNLIFQVFWVSCLCK